MFANEECVRSDNGGWSPVPSPNAKVRNAPGFTPTKVDGGNNFNITFTEEDKDVMGKDK